MTESFGPAVEVNGRPVADEGADRMWVVLAHAGVLLISFLAPLFVMLTRGKESPYVRRQAVEALNFQITVAIGMALSSVLVLAFVGAISAFVIGIAAVVLPVLAASKTYRGESYQYPLTIRLVK